MEVIEIGKTQLIFVLDREDMTKYKIDAEQETSDLRDGFSRLVNDLGVGERFLSGVLVQIFDAKNGGCEMFVTKISDETDQFGDVARGDKKYIYVFSKLDWLISACRMLSGTKGSAVTYIDEANGTYYLVLDCECRYMDEFFGKRCKDNTYEFLNERCTLLCANAIEKLSPLA